MRRGCGAPLRFQIVAGVCAALLSFSVAVSAQDNQPTPTDIKAAARAFDNAREAYGSEDYETAADQFEEADGHAPSAVALQWAIESHHQAGHAARAATLAALARQRHPDVAELVEIADKVIEESESKLLEVQVVCEEPCELLVDNKIVHGRPAATRTLYLAPGGYSVRASFSEKRMSDPAEVSGEAGEARSVIFAPPALAVPNSTETASLEGMDDPFAEGSSVEPILDEPPRKKSGWSPTVFWVGASLTAVSGVVTLWSGLDTQNNPGPDVVRDKCRGQDTSCREYQDGLSRQRRTNILLGVTGGLAAFTIVSAIVTDWSGSKPARKEAVRRAAARETAWTIEPWFSVGRGASLGATGRF